MTSVPEQLNGPNYATWVKKIQAYLEFEQLHFVIVSACPVAFVSVVPALAEGANTVAITAHTAAIAAEQPLVNAAQDKIDRWTNADGRTKGVLKLRCNDAIISVIESLATAKEMWDALATLYGKPGMSTVFTDFKRILHTNIPDHKDPTQALDDMAMSYNRLTTNDFAVPEHIRAAYSSTKVPTSMEAGIFPIVQGKLMKELTVQVLRDNLLLQWDQKHGRTKSSSVAHTASASAHKLSAIKSKTWKSNFQKQSSAPSGSNAPSGSGGQHWKKTDCGARSGKKFKARENAKGKGKARDNSQHHGHLASSMIVDLPDEHHMVLPASFDTVNDLIVTDLLQGPFTTTDLLHSVQDVRALGNTPVSYSEGTPFFPHTKQAIKNVRAASETFVNLERIREEEALLDRIDTAPSFSSRNPYKNTPSKRRLIEQISRNAPRFCPLRRSIVELWNLPGLNIARSLTSLLATRLL